MLLHGAVKRSIIARISTLADAAGPADALYGVQVSRALPPEPERKCVFGGRLRFVQAAVLAERNAAYQQTIQFDVRIRVVDLGDDVDGTEDVAEGIEQAVAAGVVAEPSLVGTAGRIAVVAGDSDPTMVMAGPEPTVTVNRVLTVEITVAMAGV